MFVDSGDQRSSELTQLFCVHACDARVGQTKQPWCSRLAASQVQAPDRAQTMTHDHKRHGTTTLLAALNVLDSKVIGQCQQRHTHAEWLKFLRQITLRHITLNRSPQSTRCRQRLYDVE